jgi:energy-coupling factor transporter ATP-binding protein EcfA2
MLAYATLPAFAAVEDQKPAVQQQAEKVRPDPGSVKILGVTPESIKPGEIVRITLSASIPELSPGITRERAKESFSVQIGGRRADIVGVVGVDSFDVQTATDLARGPAMVRVVGVGIGATYPVQVIDDERTALSFLSALPPQAAILLSVGALALAGFGGVAVMLVMTRRVRSARKEAESEQVRFSKERREEAAPLASGDASGPTLVASPAADIAPAPLPLPEIPQALVQAVAQGECVLYWGGGVSAQAGYPTWREGLSSIVEKNASVKDLRKTLSTGRLSIVAEVLASRLGRETMIAEVGQLWGSGRDVPALAQRLGSLKFANAVTATWDPLVEEVFRSRSPVIVEGVTTTNVEPLLSREAFCIVRLWGSLQRTQTLLLTHTEYKNAVSGNPSYMKYLSSLALSQPHLFVGASLETIEEYLGDKPRDSSAPTHYALVHETPDIEVQREVFRARYGVELLIFRATPGWPELTQLVENIAEAAAERKSTQPATDITRVKLEWLMLKNIGPFEDLRLKLNGGWNVILGNNGSGKSTILKAITLCLCGDDPRAAFAGARLLRAGAPDGFIELAVGTNTYRTTLSRTGNTVNVHSGLRATPLRQGSPWVVVAFPPLRGTTTGDPSGPTTAGSSTPLVEDVLPMLLGPVDTRMNNLKQWLVNLDVLGTPGQGVTPQQATQNLALRDRFFELFKDFIPGSCLKFSKVERPEWRVLVNTDDGEVSIDQVSQGMSSILGWIGPLLQRMYEIHASSEDPEGEAAVVLIDEIDAHLHPAWQQRIVGTLKKHFENVQFIVTTHSPLIVGELEKGQIHHVQRAEGEVVMAPSIHSPRGLGVAGLLTSDMFGLGSHLDTPTRNKLRRKRLLALKKSLTAKESEELKRLDKELGGIDYTTVIRDPLYSRFVDALTAADAGADDSGPATKEVDEHRRRSAEQVLADVKKDFEEGNAADKDRRP